MVDFAPLGLGVGPRRFISFIQQLSPHSFNSLLAALLRRGRRRAASALLAAFLRCPGASPDVATLNTLIHGLSTASPRPSSPALLRLFRFLPEAYAFAPDAITYNSMLAALCRAGDLATARRLFDGMRVGEQGGEALTWSPTPP